MKSDKPVVRFAPSPTGLFHIGSARSALFNYLFAKQHGGKFILRIENTDKERSKPEYEKNILESLDWLGIKYDEIYKQSERTEIYKKYLAQLITKERLYVSKEKEGERSEVVRFRNPNKKISFRDLIRGVVTMDTSDLGDFVVAKSLTEPLFHFTNALDDWLMGVTHIIRGEDHISNTPRQILILEALGAAVPIYAHIPLILNADRSKLSKRSGATALTDYRDQGYLPEAMVNFLVLLGWSPQKSGGAEAKEILTFSELIKIFDLSAVQKGGAVFDLAKLNALNREHMKKLSDLEWAKKSGIEDSRLISLLRGRINNFSEAKRLIAAGEFDYLNQQPHYAKNLLKNTDHLAKVKEILQATDDWTKEGIKKALWDYAAKVGRSEVFWPLRVALTGRERSPDPFTIAALLGKKETLARLDYAKNL